MAIVADDEMGFACDRALQNTIVIRIASNDS